MAEAETTVAKKDIFRDTYLRYLGYANEVGEAFRPLVPRALVRASYVVASSYALADATSKWHAAANQKSVQTSTQLLSPAPAFFDALIWQGLASVIIPGLTINRLCALSLVVIRRTLPHLPSVTQKGATTAIGLLAIPFIISPIDRFVDASMDRTVRKLFICSNGNGR